MIGIVWWQSLLNALGWVLAKLYDLIPNYGVAIILLTVAIRIVLLPLGIKQIRSMQAMQAIQPKLKVLQQKHKGDRQKLNEEMMKLYREHGVNPLAGCLPMLLQLPVLIALYSVLRFPQHPVHLPKDSMLEQKIVTQIYQGKPASGTTFAGANLLCSAQEAGRSVKVLDPKATDPKLRTIHLDCGSGIPVRIPYYVLALLMIGTTYYQQRQMTKAAPPGASQQQQMLTRIMPIMFGFWGIIFPAGLVLYWTTSNAWQVGQQHWLLKARARLEGSDGVAKPTRTARAPRQGFFQRMMQQAEADRARRQAAPGKPPPKASQSDGGDVGNGSGPSGAGKGGSSGSGGGKGSSAQGRPSSGSGRPGSRGTPGGSRGGRKKRRKR